MQHAHWKCRAFTINGRRYFQLDHRWIPRTKASDAELLYFLWSVPWINGWVNNREIGDLRRHRAHFDIIVMEYIPSSLYNGNPYTWKDGFVALGPACCIVRICLLWSNWKYLLPCLFSCYLAFNMNFVNNFPSYKQKQLRKKMHITTERSRCTNIQQF